LKKVTVAATAIACTVLLLFACFMATGILNAEVSNRDREIADLKNQVNALQACLAANSSMVKNLTDTVDRLTMENEQLTNLTEVKQYQLMQAWHEISVLKNQTAKLEAQIAELKG